MRRKVLPRKPGPLIMRSDVACGLATGATVAVDDIEL
jgi:hypothetical protein